jgi:two-component system, OmpR family, response regulator
MPLQDCQSVLYVDDDPDICVVVQAALCLIAGLEVHTAQSGALAIDLVYDLRPDLLVLDVMMPGLDGPATYRRLRESPLIASTPVIFMTAKVLPTEIARLMHMGAIGVVQKPFDPITLGEEMLAMWSESHGARQASAASAEQGDVRVLVDSLTREFIGRIRKDVMILGDLAVAVQRGKSSLLREIEHLGHSISGAGATFGFPAISESGRAIESLAEELISTTPNTRLAVESAAQRLSACIGRLAQDVEAASGSPACSGSHDGTLN